MVIIFVCFQRRFGIASQWRGQEKAIGRDFGFGRYHALAFHN